METEENGNPRLGVRDKRLLFAVLQAKIERLFNLNRFPVDINDYALSLEEPEVEAAWRLLVEKLGTTTLDPVGYIDTVIDDQKFLLSEYDGKNGYQSNAVFIDHGNDNLEVQVDNRFYCRVSEWSRRQVRLEEQMLRALKVIKGIVTSCNTVGQYQRVSPELIGFLPHKYAIALGQMVKNSPYPAIDVTALEIDSAMSTLAYAALQPQHLDEEHFNRGQTTYGGDPTYRITHFPRTSGYVTENVRKCEI